MKKILAFALAILMLSGCASSENQNENVTSSTEQTKNTGESVSMTEFSVEQPDFPIPEVKPTTPIDYEYNVSYCLDMYQAEKGELSGQAKIQNDRSGYLFDGYVTGIVDGEGSLRIKVNAVSSQHYNITVCAAADGRSQGYLYIDGNPIGKFVVSGIGEFEALKFENVYLSEGEHYISFERLSAVTDIDYVIFENSPYVLDFSYEANRKLCNQKASKEAKELYSFLCDNFGKYVISAQQCTSGTNDEIYEILKHTGKYPAIRFSDMMSYAIGKDNHDIEYAIDYAKNGGIVGYTWYWVKGGSVNADESDFNLKEAVNAHDIARIDQKALDSLYESGAVSDDTMSLLEDIDRVAEQFLKLKEENIPVLFRPLPEASGGWYWWGEDKDSYLWLYRLIYYRLADYWHLDNIIWIWNGQSADWYVGDEWCDIIALDVYDFSGEACDSSSRVNLLHSMSKLSKGKLVAISECNVLPSAQNVYTDRAYWSFVNVWSENCVWSPLYGFGGYMNEVEWVLFYNSTAVLTRDELVENN